MVPEGMEGWGPVAHFGTVGEQPRTGVAAQLTESPPVEGTSRWEVSRKRGWAGTWLAGAPLLCVPQSPDG